MKCASWKQLFVITCILAFADTTPAQDLGSSGSPPVQGAEGRSLVVGTSELSFWTGYSSSNPTLIGRTTDRPFFEFNVQYARVFRTGDNWALKYTPEIIPVAIIRQPRQGYAASGNPVDLPGSRQKIYGAGISPVGLQMNFRRGCVLQPYINGTAGVLYFKEQVPVADSSKFNFALGLGVGVEIWHRENQSIRLGYAYHHISNAYTARQNPGVDSNLFYAGYAWSWGQ